MFDVRKVIREQLNKLKYNFLMFDVHKFIKEQLSKLKFSSILLVFIMLLFVIPDIIFVACSEWNNIPSQFKSWLFIFGLSLCFVISDSKESDATWLIIFAVLQIIQFCHMKYFNEQISPQSFYLFFLEYRDVLTEAKFEVWRYIWIFPLVIIPFYLIYYINTKYEKKRCTIKYSFFLMPIFVLSIGLGNSRLLSWFNPNNLRFPLSNSIKAFCGYIVMMQNGIDTKKYLLYTVNDIRVPSEPINIVYILGESVNYEYMSLFGYNMDTTPELVKTSKENDNFIYVKGIGGGVCTFSACKFLMNVICEPDNSVMTGGTQTNLFRLAKSHGFKTFYVASQSDHMLSALGGANYIDKIITYDTFPLKFNEKQDEFLIELLPELELSDKNFIVVHQWCMHSPYQQFVKKDDDFNDDFYKKLEEIKDSHVIDYLKAMRYNDSVVSRIFNLFNKQTDGHFYIIWTSDHNEGLGEHGFIGHGGAVLRPGIAQVPFVVQSNDSSFLSKVKDIYMPTHYEMTKIIANLLGFEVINPNEQEGVFYINGSDFNGTCGYIKFTKDKAKNIVKYEEPNYGRRKRI